MEVVRFVAESVVRDQVAAAFAAHHAELMAVLPWADVEHVGSTAVPGSLTKGDLDIQVRVPAERFTESDARLAKRYERNVGSDFSDTFSPFKNDDLPVPLGVQLTVIDGPEDFFWRFRELMCADATLVEAYNAIKRRFEGRAMDDYREEKSRFLESLMTSAAYQAL